MAVEIGALRAILSLDSAAFSKGAKRAQASMNGLQRSLSRTSDRLNAIGRKMTTRLTLPLAGIAAVAVKSSLSTIDAQAKMAQSLDTSTRSMQILGRAADRAGISTGQLEQIGRQLTKRLSQAAAGTGPAAQGLERLGLSAEELMKLNLDDRIGAINEAIEEHIPKAQQAAIAAQLFGDEAGLLASRLDAGVIRSATEEIDRFGLAVSEVDADKIENANDAMSALGLAARGLANQLTVALAPTLRAIAERMAQLADWFSDLSPRVKTLAVTGAALAAAIGPVAIALGAAAAGAAALATPIGAVIALAAAGGTAFLALKGGASEAEKAMRAAQGAQDALNAALGHFYETASPNAAKSAIALANDNYTLAESAIAAAEAEIAKFEATRNNLRENLETMGGGLSMEAEARLSAERAKLDRQKMEAERLLDEARRARDRAARSVTGTMSDEMTATTAATNSLKVEVEGLGDALEGLGSVGGGSGGGGGAGAAADGLGRVSETLEGVRQRVSSASEGFTGLRDGLKEVFKGIVNDTQNFADSVEQALRNLANNLINSGIDQLFNAIFGAPGGGLDTGLKKGIFAPLTNFDGFMARGGGVAAGKSYVVGEEGPELFTPGRSGAITPNETLFNNAKGGTIQQELAVHIHENAAEGQHGVKHSPGRVDVFLKKAQADNVLSGGLDRAMSQRFGLRPKARGS